MNQYLISEAEINDFVADILSGEKPKPILKGKKPVKLIVEGAIVVTQVGDYIGGRSTVKICEENKGKKIIILKEE